MSNARDFVAAGSLAEGIIMIDEFSAAEAARRASGFRNLIEGNPPCGVGQNKTMGGVQHGNVEHNT